ncbi:helix-turn-helix domain-containing protein [Propionivibrio sp.]|uniref:helix-turn-helix domain-containing protein n=1 Tax=Propionivibrio sp. TaxID=2212460 RepID=UPI003BEFCEA7
MLELSKIDFLVTLILIGYTMKLPKLFLTDGAAARAHRHKLGLNQTAFWKKLGLTQSGSSRYESGRNIPMPVQLLLHIAYAPEKRVLELVEFLRTTDTPE